MDEIQRALLPTLMCAAAAQGLTKDLSTMMFSETGGTGETTSALCARLGDYDKRTPLHLAASEGKKKKEKKKKQFLKFLKIEFIFLLLQE